MTPAAAATNPRRYFALVLLCLGFFMDVLDFQIVNVALPTIQSSLGFSDAGLQWVVSAYALTYAGFLLLGGRAADLWGRRRVFMLGVALFGVGSVVAALALSPVMLIAARALQGLGAAVMTPSALSIVTGMFTEERERNRALGAWGAVGSGGFAAGVLLGGVLTDAFGWRSVFFINVPVSVLLLLLAPVVIPESREQNGARQLDLPGAFLVTSGLALLVYGLSRAEGLGLGSLQVLVPLAFAVVLLGLFVLVERRASAPLVPLSIFRLRSLAGADLAALLASATFAPMLFLLSLYLQRAAGYSPSLTGLSFLPLTLVIAFVSGSAGPRLVTRFGVRPVLTVGLLFMSGSFLVLSQVQPGGGLWPVVLVGTLLAALGQGLAFAGFIIGGLSGVRAEQQGLASGLVGTAQQVGAALGLAVLVSVLVSRESALEALGVAAVPALVGGIQQAFFVSAGIALLGALLAYAMVRGAGIRVEGESENKESALTLPARGVGACHARAKEPAKQP